jgi:stage II sporulation protein D
VRRVRFLTAAFVVPFATLGGWKSARASQDEFDPATSSPTAALRVLLGPGEAQALPGGGFTFNGRRYRGTFAPAADGSIVSTVSLEEYLYSVVPREMSPSWPDAALQAQAICARTYVLQRSNPHRNYDVVPSELDQVYGGVASESPAGRAAVDATHGQVLRFDDRFAQVMYSSCCGGHTEASSEAWGGAPFPYLQGVPCTYCTASPDYRWRRDLPLANLTETFATELAPFGALRDVRIGATDSSGRARTIELVAERGSAFVKGSAFRMRVGPRIVRSLLITKLDSQSIEGGGLGHGVGLCQWGARGMALDGRTARDILSQYFPGTTIGNE